jgi:hypothetical protein
LALKATQRRLNPFVFADCHLGHREIVSFLN